MVAPPLVQLRIALIAANDFIDVGLEEIAQYEGLLRLG